MSNKEKRCNAIPYGRMHAVIAVSGGMDSTCLLVELLRNNYENIHAFSFDYGQKHKIELDRLDQNLEYLAAYGFNIIHKRIDLKSVMGSMNSALTNVEIDMPEGHYADENMKLTVVPNRNAIFSAVIYAQAQNIANIHDAEVDIALGVHSGDHAIYPDCRREFYYSLEEAFKLGNWNSEKVNFYLPYINRDKSRILFEAYYTCEQLGLDFNTLLSNTNTSYEPDELGRASGKTGSDVERILAFNEIGMKDPVEYVEGWEKALAYALQQEENYGK